MPAFDGTGPTGTGSMTGRGMGRCGGKSRGLGQGFGRGMRRGLNRFYCGAQAWSKEDIKDYKKALQEELEDIDKELNEADKN
ncbi:hypothetical protein A2334_04580 [Candidatus Roizmanbacteria bacterium RIFOXYB2_FULL_38_10]|uniref:Cytoplasmic protein n=1 Tax=Candidatus Roizmanbacteria bacterium RIFOXYD1_FULL_38_12 TaxID=1802093 RepID=A0A1F7KZJ2_9BACT|nr:MAG: hypothetical protein A3K47_00685 [Candidatus Roizmanbacteria bacterium RIFOXYA2_FULL_38_14]OGK63306.1 MAG: hypothetical protein A3K27_00685 [Candidatus Roizmanbacteria bacterium RIFOXYA1_FULL_37_12]OGK65152.1 MAG: hypothetical protein A3K38_00685 [Candidatus Roizmanbacteria bacterium RIFOXYB1_FULL_40_23]OGK68707.1 MAG: hypothetical protein A2334_04580 [Candidatus Roizmanbacteria bacterium RIFOXYB2_FULL_38_10]OGK69556.1 MAG: hypothetical protein A3K21_00685 [Candidatus Roizmanbacteria ba